MAGGKAGPAGEGRVVFIRAVDQALENLLRTELPLPEEIGEVTFDAPTSNWSATLSRLTVNLFLYEVTRSPHPAPTPTQRVDANGRVERRGPQPMIRLGYLVSAWAGSPRDEHQLLGNVIDCLVPMVTVPAEHLPVPVDSAIHLSFAADDRNHLRDIWSAAGGQLKASFTLQVDVAANAFQWDRAATPVGAISTLVGPRRPE